MRIQGGRGTFFRVMVEYMTFCGINNTKKVAKKNDYQYCTVHLSTRHDCQELAIASYSFDYRFEGF